MEAQELADILVGRHMPPTAKNLASAVGQLAREGVLADGELLPPVRELAAMLRISPATVSAAWSQLRERGLIEGRGRGRVHVIWAAPLPRDPRPVTQGVVDARLLLPDPLLVPTLDESLQFATRFTSAADYDDAPILPALARAVVQTWPRRFAPQALVVANGLADGMWASLRALSVPGDRVLVENPGLPLTQRVVRRLGLLPVPFSMDQDGPRLVDVSRGLRQSPVAMIWQSTAQIPTGVRTSPERMGQLLRLLGERSCVPIEVDDVGDLSTTPLPELDAVTPNLLTLRSYEKAYGPDIRLAVIAGGGQLIEQIHGQFLIDRQWISRILQGSLAWLLGDAETQRGVRASAQEYQRRRDLLLTHLEMPSQGTTGLCLWLPVLDEPAAVSSAEQEGLLVHPGSLSSVGSVPSGHIRLATTRLRGDAAGLAAIVTRAAAAVWAPGS